MREFVAMVRELAFEEIAFAKAAAADSVVMMIDEIGDEILVYRRADLSDFPDPDISKAVTECPATLLPVVVIRSIGNGMMRTEVLTFAIP